MSREIGWTPPPARRKGIDWDEVIATTLFFIFILIVATFTAIGVTAFFEWTLDVEAAGTDIYEILKS